MASLITTVSAEGSGVLSIVDEDAFGEETLHSGGGQPSIVHLVMVAGSYSLSCEIYTRLDQIFDRRRNRSDSMDRLKHLLQIRPSLARVFVGVESGSDSQLRRYNKGQTTQGIVDALRAGSLLGLPLEFGFITFDPLLVQHELVENLEFLTRTDVLLPPTLGQSVESIYSIVTSGGGSALPRGDALFTRVAYMATELEMFANSSFFRQLSNAYPHLVGKYDSSFARYDFSYQDPVVGRVAAWCRVWTEGTFRPIYRMRLAGRTLKGFPNPYEAVIRRYREATFGLLLALTGRFSKSLRPRVTALSIETGMPPLEVSGDQIHRDELRELWQWVVSDAEVARFTEKVELSVENLERRRDT